MKKSILLLIALFTACQALAQVNVVEGHDAVYVYVSDRRISEAEPYQNITKINLYRQNDKEKKQVNLGRVQAALTREDFSKIAGEGTLNDIRAINELKTQDEAWSFVKSHPLIKDYGFVVFNPDFSVAMGAVYKDIDTKKSGAVSVKYKVEFLDSNNKVIKEEETSLRLGNKPMITKPLVADFIEADSSVVVSWKADAETSPDVFFGQVWVREKSNAPYKQVGYALASKEDSTKQVVFQWKQKTVPSTSYGFYLIPTTLHRLPGPVSDTLSLISRNFKGLPQIPIATAKDSSLGIFLKWEPLAEQEFFSGIVLERSRSPKDGFMVIDTLAASVNEYLDTRVLPNIMYHYRFRLLGLRQYLSPAAAYVAHTFTVPQLPLEAPEKVKVTYDKQGNIRIGWKLLASPVVSGYQVFRAAPNESYQLISNLTQDSVFVDTTVRNSRLSYKYAVKALNYENVESEYSASVFANPQTTVLPVTPYDVEAYTEFGINTLRWKDMVSYDSYIVAYNIYRKQVASRQLAIEAESSPDILKKDGFVKINNQPVTEVLFADKTIQPGAHYAYAVTAIDEKGVEGNALGAKLLESVAVPLRSPEIYARATSKGVEITWTDILGTKIDSYEIFVRQPLDKSPRKIGEATAGKEHFIDNKVVAGQLYFYSMKVKVGNNESNLGNEKSVRK